MTNKGKGGKKRGFTLVEMLVALAVFGFVSASAIAVMRISIVSKERVDAASSRIRDIQIARNLMKADFAQAVLRPVRDEFGNVEPAFAGGAAMGGDGRADALVALTRGGWTNPGGTAPRASLQRVEYAFRDGALIRRTRSYLDAAGGAPETETRLLEGLERVEFAFNVAADQWTEDYRAGSENSTFPRAVRLRGWFDGAEGALTLMFLTPAEIE